MKLKNALANFPFIAILRGVTPDEAIPIGKILFDAGFRCMEVPLSSSNAFDSIARLTKAFAQNDNVLIGAGTVTTAKVVKQVVACGGSFIMSPSTDPAIIQVAHQQNLIACPGFFTPSEAYSAIKAGATYLKLFPAMTAGPNHFKALSTVLPKEVMIVAVGGITPQNLVSFHTAGVRAFGLGSALYRSGQSLTEVAANANAFVQAWKNL